MLNQIAPLKTLHELQLKAKDISYLDSSTPEYRLVYMIMDVAHHKLCGPPGFIDKCELKKGLEPRNVKIGLNFREKSTDT
jgi:hypothetical protein